jgi:hypothetical protein
LRLALDPTFQLLLLPPSADLFRPFLTYPVLVVNSCEVFTVLFLWISHSIVFYWLFGFSFFAGFFGSSRNAYLHA